MRRERNRDDRGDTIRYGKRQLEDGPIAVVAIAKDLSDLPMKEQLYWASFEIDDPSFSDRDINYGKFVRENFEAEELDHTDPLQTLWQTLEDVNRLVGGQLYKHRKHPYLYYPTANTLEEYRDAHRELYKVVGPDSLDDTLLRKILIRTGCASENETQSQEGDRKGQWKGNWALFKLLCTKVGLDVTPFDVCHTRRTESAHIIIEPALPTSDYRRGFADDVGSMLAELSKLKDKLADHSMDR